MTSTHQAYRQVAYVAGYLDCTKGRVFREHEHEQEFRAEYQRGWTNGEAEKARDALRNARRNP